MGTLIGMCKLVDCYQIGRRIGWTPFFWMSTASNVRAIQINADHFKILAFRNALNGQNAV